MVIWAVEIRNGKKIISRAFYKTQEDALRIKMKLGKIDSKKTIIIYPVYN